MTTFSKLTSLRTGGEISKLSVCGSQAELISHVANLKAIGQDFIVLGGCTNIIAPDEPYSPHVLLLRGNLVDFNASVQQLYQSIDGETSGLTSQRSQVFPTFAGLALDDLVRWSVVNGFTGLEPLSGVPGTVGGAVVQNAGAYGVEVADLITDVRLLHSRSGRTEMVRADSLEFAYRTSRLKGQTVNPSEIVLSATFKLRKFDPEAGLTIPARLRSELDKLVDMVGQPIALPKTPAELRQSVLILRDVKDMLEDKDYPEVNRAVKVRPETGTVPAVPPSSLPSAGFDITPSFPGFRKDDRGPEGAPLPQTNHLRRYNRWSCGSFFTNPIVPAAVAQSLPQEAPRYEAAEPGHVKIGAAWLIEEAGFPRGFSPLNQDGVVGLSSAHALAITNRGRATTNDILTFAKTIADEVHRKFQIQLTLEPIVL